MKVYFDNAASAPMDPHVFEHMKPYYCDWVGNPSSTHAHGRALRAVIEESRRTIANLLNCSPGEICFTSGGTEADNMAIRGAVKGYGIKHIISAHTEHHAVGHSIEELEKEGLIQAHWLKVNDKGEIDLKELESLLQAHPNALVCLMHGNNEIGTLHDIEAIGHLCKAHGAHFHSDTVQTMGHFAYDLQKIPVDFLVASAHKFYGPKGVGFLFMRNDKKIPSMIHGGGQERNHRAGTENIVSIIGMAYALKKCVENLEKKTTHLKELKRYMKAQLESHIPGVAFNGNTDIENSLPTVLNVAPPCGEGDAMLTFMLDLAGISASGGSACNSGANQGSHVLNALGHPASRCMNSVRFSFGPQNTKEEIDYAVSELTKIVNQKSLV